jgi:hypothetical protein
VVLILFVVLPNLTSILMSIIKTIHPETITSLEIGVRYYSPLGNGIGAFLIIKTWKH